MIAWLTQTAAVLSLNLRSMPQRWVSSLVAVVGIAGVVMVMVGVLSIAEGFRATMGSRSSPETVMVMRAGSTGELDSGLSRDEARIIAQAPGIRRGADGPLVSEELFVIVDLPRKTTGGDSNVPLRGVLPQAIDVRGEVRLAAGRMFEPGVNELVAGVGAQDQFEGLDLGSTLELGQNTWTVVGLLEASGGIAESELWADVRVLQSLYRRGSSLQTVRVRLESEAAFQGFKDTLTSDPRLNVRVIPEGEFYASQSAFLSNFVGGVGVALGMLMGLGALFGAVNTMYTAVASRTREIATLRAVGFGPGSVTVSVLVESLLLGIAGGILGGLVAYVLFNGFTVATLNWQSFSQVSFAFAVTPKLLTMGMVYSVLLGFIGGLLPCIRAARLPVTAALREL